MQMLRAAIIAALFLFPAAMQALAQDVTLRSRDGSIELTGSILGFDGEFYRIETEFGEMTVDSSGVLCTGPGCPSLTDFVAKVAISGSSTIGKVLLPALIEAFALREGLGVERTPETDGQFTYILTDPVRQKPVGQFSFHLTNTHEGFADLLANEADIVMALREIRPAEVEMARQAGMGDLEQPNRSRVLALDALVPMVAANNPVDTISLDDFGRVLSGDIDNWQDLGGPDAPIEVHLRGEQSGLTQGLRDRLKSATQLQLAVDATRHKTNTQLAEAVSKDPFGLGFGSYSEIGNAKALVLNGDCGFKLRASRGTIKTEDYPLTAPMFLYVPARRLPALAREFLRFTRGPTAQIVIRRAGFVDQTSEEVPTDLQGNRFANAIAVASGEEGLKTLQNMTGTLSSMRRLTTSFRFETGSTRLDAQSRSNSQQLARALEAGHYNGRKLVFVGFSDGVGPAAANLNIARQRARVVLDAVKNDAEIADFSQLEVDAIAFGEAMPMACDDTHWGRKVNRRVEIWVR